MMRSTLQTYWVSPTPMPPTTKKQNWDVGCPHTRVDVDAPKTERSDTAISLVLLSCRRLVGVGGDQKWPFCTSIQKKASVDVFGGCLDLLVFLSQLLRTRMIISLHESKQLAYDGIWHKQSFNCCHPHHETSERHNLN